MFTDMFFAPIDRYGDTRYDGYAIRDWLVKNVDLCVYIAGAYLWFVFKGPDVVRRFLPPSPVDEKGVRHKPRWLTCIWVLWNLFLCVFSFYGASHIVPVVAGHVRDEGMRAALCTLREEEYYRGRTGLAVGLFAMSKLPEFFDTVLIVLSGKRELPFLQWFHHVTTFLFAWHCYATGSSALNFAACLNYSVHAVMYLYFTLAEAGYKGLVRPFARYITMIQILQMIAGLAFIFSISYYKYTDWKEGRPEGSKGSCAGTKWDSVRIHIFIAGVNLILFVHMYVKAYLKGGKKRAAAAKSAETKKTK